MEKGSVEGERAGWGQQGKGGSRGVGEGSGDPRNKREEGTGPKGSQAEGWD